MVPTGRTIRTQFNGTFNIAGSGTGCQGDYVQVCDIKHLGVKREHLFVDKEIVGDERELIFFKIIPACRNLLL
jgi:hypothetical protein